MDIRASVSRSSCFTSAEVVRRIFRIGDRSEESGGENKIHNIPIRLTMRSRIISARNGPVYSAIPYRHLFCSRISYRHL
jgi:hypothetical protein